jgi:hypothetical protein
VAFRYERTTAQKNKNEKPFHATSVTEHNHAVNMSGRIHLPSFFLTTTVRDVKLSLLQADKWGCSSAGRAQGWQSWGQGFDPPQLHQEFKKDWRIANPFLFG